jgi:gluconolactonase
MKYALLVLAGATCVAAHAANDYKLGPDSERQPGVPAGRVEKYVFTNSMVFPGTRRDCWVYIPAQYDGSRAAALMVFQDGGAYVSTNGDQRVPIVFDNLIHKGEMPVTIGLFTNPGMRQTGDAGDAWTTSNRSFEYDSLGGAYAKFLVEELIPDATNRFHLNVSADPEQRATAGMSSGAIAAFTAAWERPDQFHKVLSQIGSFVNIRGGNVYPSWIRKTERKPLRVFLQDGSNDLNNLHGNWPLANQEMESALGFAGYDHTFVLGEGSHSGRHGGAILPDSLRWLWRPATATPAPLTKDNLGGDEALSKVLAGGGAPGDWQLVADGMGFTDAACGGSDGSFYFSDLNRSIVFRTPPGGKPEPWLEGGPKISGLKFGPGGRLYAATQGSASDKRKKIITIDPATKAMEDIAVDVQPNDLAVSKTGFIYYTDTGAGEVVRVPVSARGMGGPPAVAGGIKAPNGISLSPDQRQLAVSEYGGSNVWVFLVAADGSLRGGERLMTLQTPVGRTDSGGDGMTVDADGRYYVTSHLGIQMFDATGRLGGIIARPQDKAAVSCAFAGPDMAELFVCCSDKIYRRKTLVHGAAAAK